MEEAELLSIGFRSRLVSCFDFCWYQQSMNWLDMIGRCHIWKIPAHRSILTYWLMLTLWYLSTCRDLSSRDFEILGHVPWLMLWLWFTNGWTCKEHGGVEEEWFWIGYDLIHSAKLTASAISSAHFLIFVNKTKCPVLLNLTDKWYIAFCNWDIGISLFFNFTDCTGQRV